ncbi:MAG: DUF5331 domain-containing protein [Cyanomargarita calcarea GSE-NOS-MK-12-04C]|jgi:hypothetical protein|uniref:DUF5331 domain-containing protein n=1 Tax=Cyanomargarita calcarea GSE-NOS-MK-12-04C TaxID=2839659 RepID=A0A951QV58_9CYAN|nr:DUF5331 domain-containing protein [Cyanomargarita calcarea GSE-NOS-MK-12-04C]
MEIQQLRQSLKQKWVNYYHQNRSWLIKMRIWGTYDGGRRPSSGFILATLSVLEPQLDQILPFILELNSNPDQIITALGLNFNPEEQLHLVQLETQTPPEPAPPEPTQSNSSIEKRPESPRTRIPQRKTIANTSGITEVYEFPALQPEESKVLVSTKIFTQIQSESYEETPEQREPLVPAKIFTQLQTESVPQNVSESTIVAIPAKTQIQNPPEPLSIIPAKTQIQNSPEPLSIIPAKTQIQNSPEPLSIIPTKTQIQNSPEPLSIIPAKTQIQNPPEPLSIIPAKTQIQIFPEPLSQISTKTEIQSFPEAFGSLAIAPNIENKGILVKMPQKDVPGEVNQAHACSNFNLASWIDDFCQGAGWDREETILIPF